MDHHLRCIHLFEPCRLLFISFLRLASLALPLPSSFLVIGCLALPFPLSLFAIPLSLYFSIMLSLHARVCVCVCFNGDIGVSHCKEKR